MLLLDNINKDCVSSVHIPMHLAGGIIVIAKHDLLLPPKRYSEKIKGERGGEICMHTSVLPHTSHMHACTDIPTC